MFNATVVELLEDFALDELEEVEVVVVGTTLEDGLEEEDDELDAVETDAEVLGVELELDETCALELELELLWLPCGPRKKMLPPRTTTTATATITTYLLTKERRGSLCAI